MNNSDYKKELEDALSRYGTISNWYMNDDVVYFVFFPSSKDAWEVAFLTKFYNTERVVKTVLNKLDVENEKTPATN